MFEVRTTMMVMAVQHNVPLIQSNFKDPDNEYGLFSGTRTMGKPTRYTIQLFMHGLTKEVCKWLVSCRSSNLYLLFPGTSGIGKTPG